MVTTAVADEMLRYMYVASMRPLTTLAALLVLVSLIVVLALVAWREHQRVVDRTRRRVGAGSAGVRVGVALVGCIVGLFSRLPS